MNLMLQDNIFMMIDIQDNPAAFAATLPRVLTYCYLPANAINTLLFPNNLRLIVVMMMIIMRMMMIMMTMIMMMLMMLMMLMKMTMPSTPSSSQITSG